MLAKALLHNCIFDKNLKKKVASVNKKMIPTKQDRTNKEKESTTVQLNDIFWFRKI